MLNWCCSCMAALLVLQLSASRALKRLSSAIKQQLGHTWVFQTLWTHLEAQSELLLKGKPFTSHKNACGRSAGTALWCKPCSMQPGYEPGLCMVKAQAQLRSTRRVAERSAACSGVHAKGTETRIQVPVIFLCVTPSCGVTSLDIPD